MLSNFQLVKNPFLNDNSRLERTFKMEPRNTVKVGTEFLGQTVKFEVDARCIVINQMSVEINLSRDVGTVIVPNYGYAFRIFKNIIVRSITGAVIAQTNDFHGLARFTELSGTPFFNYLDQSGAVDNDFDNVNITMFLPLFLWFSENYKQELNMYEFGKTPVSRELITVELEVADYIGKYEASDLPISINDASFYLHVKGNFPKNFEYPRPTKWLGYNVYRERQESVPNGSTYFKKILTVPFPSYVMFLYLFQTDNLSNKQITKYRISSASEVIVEYDYRNNFDMPAMQKIGFPGGEAPSINWFSREKMRGSLENNNDYIIATQSMAPLFLEIFFDNPGANCTIDVQFEYVQPYELSKGGILEVPYTGLYNYSKALS